MSLRRLYFLSGHRHVIAMIRGTVRMTPLRLCASAVSSHCVRLSAQSQPPLKVQSVCDALHATLATLLEDRQCLYRRTVLSEKLNPLRHRITEILQQHSSTPRVGSSMWSVSKLSTQQITEWRDACCADSNGKVGNNKRIRMDFYNALLMSAAVTSAGDIRLVLDTMSQQDHLEPDADSYVAIMLSLIVENSPKNVVGDTAFYYFGHAIKRNGSAFITDKMWSALFVVCTVTEVAGKIVDQWWDLLVKTYENQSSPLPFGAVHGALTWCSANRDIERLMRFFQTANKRGLRLSGETMCVIHPGTLTERSEEVTVQLCQLKLLVKLIATVKSIKMDGGLREIVIKDVRRLIDSNQLRTASWGVINDLLSGLSMPSAMRLLKFISAHHAHGDGDIPFMLWASLLRRCARDYHIDQAEAIFLFIRKRFPLNSLEKGELVEIMMRMFATLPQGDYASTMSLFLEHVLRQPMGEPKIEANETMYNLLIRAADSRNAAMMTFLEASAAGVGMNEETFEAVLHSGPHASIASLSRRLPYGYHASKLDEQLHIPANVDAHLRREEALQKRGRPLVDSTGEVN